MAKKDELPEDVSASYGRVLDLDTLEGPQRLSELIAKLSSEKRAVAVTAALMLADNALRSKSREAIAKIAKALREHGGFPDELRRVTVKLRMAGIPVDEEAKRIPAPKARGKDAAVPQKLTRQ